MVVQGYESKSSIFSWSTVDFSFTPFKQNQLALETVQSRFDPPFNADQSLVTRVFSFLERNGYINFGVFKVVKPVQMTPIIATVTGKRPQVVVIGAGIAGLVAARQLKFLGFDVVVLESRNRVGGRVSTYKQGKHYADVGATIITGLTGNPIRVISHQTGMALRVLINQKCPLFLNNKWIESIKDEVLESVFSSTLEGTSLLSTRMSFNKIGDKSLSLGDGLRMVLELQERDVKEKYLKHLNDLLVLQVSPG